MDPILLLLFCPLEIMYIYYSLVASYVSFKSQDIDNQCTNMRNYVNNVIIMYCIYVLTLIFEHCIVIKSYRRDPSNPEIKPCLRTIFKTFKILTSILGVIIFLMAFKVYVKNNQYCLAYYSTNNFQSLNSLYHEMYQGCLFIVIMNYVIHLAVSMQFYK